MVMEHTAILGPSYLLQLIVELWSKHVKATTLILPLYEMAKPKSGSEDNTNGSWCLLKSQGKSKLESKSNLVLASCQHWEFRGQGELGVRRTSVTAGSLLNASVITSDTQKTAQTLAALRGQSMCSSWMLGESWQWFQSGCLRTERRD